MSFDDLDRFTDLNRKLQEAVDREGQTVEDVLFGDHFFEGEEIPKIEAAPKRRGRPPGLKESAPRKPKTSIKAILEQIRHALIHLEAL